MVVVKINNNDKKNKIEFKKAIIEVANQFKSGIINGTGMSLDDILKLVREDRPVIVWVSMNMAVPYVSTSWIYKPTGEKIKWLANEHALVVIGYNQNQVIVSDSLNGGVRYYDKGVFESRYKTYGKRALYYQVIVWERRKKDIEKEEIKKEIESINNQVAEFKFPYTYNPNETRDNYLESANTSKKR